MCEDDATVLNILSELKDEAVFPKLSSITVSNEQYAGIDWGNGEKWYTPYGRFFRYEEIKSGSHVAIIGTCYLKSLPLDSIDSIWKTGIDIDGTHFETIGSHYFRLDDNGCVPKEILDTQVPSPVIIPLMAFLDIQIPANKLRCVFADQPTEEQIIQIEKMLQQYITVKHVVLPKTGNYHAIQVYINQALPYTLVIFLSIISITNVVLHWLRREFERYRIYLICGAKRWQLVFLLSFTIAVLTLICFFAAELCITGINMIVPTGTISPLPWQFLAASFSGILFILLFVVNVKASPLMFRDKILEK